ncbi:C2H2 type master regulator of conidiophore development brlA [Fusarium oxysporum f. sp. raphani]|uniref:C2H2 type master regulator of conidiophore development brlA n=1 Tax=Fusarium oxysporum f. sp. raphani TaxID=96318 RepID=A0A8J5PI95_FUSOX|nr:C2H2 type master regulator of conidiophore development brlA [Fusarium oxysporum f. sp. raphani]
MHLESDHRFDMDGAAFSLCSQPMSCPSTIASFSSASSAYDPFTPTSRRSTPRGFGNMDFGGSYSSVPHQAELTPPPSAMRKFMFGPVKPESENASFSDSIPNTPMKREQLGFECEHMMDMNIAHHGSMGSLTPLNFFGTYSYSPDASMGPAPFTMTPTQSISGSEAAETGLPWSCANNSPISFFPDRQLSSGFDTSDLDRQSQSPIGYDLHDPDSPNRIRAQRKPMVDKIQQGSAELQRAQIRSPRKLSIKPGSASVDVVRRAMCKCDYPGCHKAFRRNEHLKRHKQTFHGEGPNSFSCEFCGKDQFNRQDNLNNHRKLHARPNGRNRGVKFIPSAVPIIEQEERSRKRRAPSKSKIAEQRGSEY